MGIPKKFRVEEGIEDTPPERIQELLNGVLEHAEGRMKQYGEAEDEWLEFKWRYGDSVEDKDEMRKDFSCMANSGGGYLILGIGDDLEVKGFSENDWHKRYRMVLSENGKITRPPNWHPAMVEYKGKEVLVIHVLPCNRRPIAINQEGKWPIYTRSGTSCRPATTEEVLEIIYGKSEKLSDSLRLDVGQAGVFDEKFKPKEKFITWEFDKLRFLKFQETLDKKDAMMKPSLFPYEKVIPLPFQTLNSVEQVQTSRSERWYGSRNSLFEIIATIETKLDEKYGILWSSWTIPEDVTDSTIKCESGVSSEALIERLKDLMKREAEYSEFAWAIHINRVFYLVSGTLVQRQESNSGQNTDYSASISIECNMGFIPNNYPILHLEGDSLELEAVNAYLSQGHSTERYNLLPPEELYLDSPDDNLLKEETFVEFLGFLGGKRKKEVVGPFLSLSSLVMSFEHLTDKIRESPISSFSRVIGNVSSFCSNMDISKKLALTGFEFEYAVVHNIGGIYQLLLFNVDFHLNQLSSQRKQSTKVDDKTTIDL